MRLVCLSDTHTMHKGLRIPDGDVLVYAGDCTEDGSVREVRQFEDWIDSLPHRTKLIVPGNHDRYLASRSLRVGTFLRNRLETVNGIRFFGTERLILPLRSRVDVLISHRSPSSVLFAQHTPRLIIHGHGPTRSNDKPGLPRRVYVGLTQKIEGHRRLMKAPRIVEIDEDRSRQPTVIPSTAQTEIADRKLIMTYPAIRWERRRLDFSLADRDILKSGQLDETTRKLLRRRRSRDNDLPPKNSQIFLTGVDESIWLPTPIVEPQLFLAGVDESAWAAPRRKCVVFTDPDGCDDDD